MIKMKVKGIDKAIKRLQKTARDIERSNRVLKEVGELGFKYAQTLAPEYTGALKAAMLNFQETAESWLIVSDPAPSDLGFPVNIPFDTGQFGNMTMWGPGRQRVPFQPRRQTSIGFMQQTANFLSKEFAQRLGLEIEHAIRKGR